MSFRAKHERADRIRIFTRYMQSDLICSINAVLVAIQMRDVASLLVLAARVMSLAASLAMPRRNATGQDRSACMQPALAHSPVLLTASSGPGDIHDYELEQ